jgi:hypothetical protein
MVDFRGFKALILEKRILNSIPKTTTSFHIARRFHIFMFIVQDLHDNIRVYSQPFFHYDHGKKPTKFLEK